MKLFELPKAANGETAEEATRWLSTPFAEEVARQVLKEAGRLYVELMARCRDTSDVRVASAYERYQALVNLYETFGKKRGDIAYGEGKR